MIAKLIFVILSFIGVETKAQYFSLSEEPGPPGDTLRIIYDTGFEHTRVISFYKADSLNIHAPVLKLGSARITDSQLSTVPTTFGWGNHASAGYSTASNSQTFTNKSGDISQWTNNSGYITGITSGNVTTALGYTPYNATNPNNYISNISSFTTSDLSEGSNFYYTDSRFNTAFSGKSTSDLSEGSNQYFTNSRARVALSSGAGISYNSTTGEITNTSIIPVGVIYIYPAASAPTGYLICDGSAVSRSTYSDLFALIGTLYGSGDGSTTFNLPDFRQRFPLGKSASGTGSSLAGTGGQIDMVYSIDPPSTSSSSDGSHSHTGTTGNPSSTSGQLVGVINVASATHTHDFTTSSNGTHTHTTDIVSFNTDSNNPAFISINFIIKY